MDGSCAGINAFDIEGYKGRFNTTLLEASPKEVRDVLVERQTQTCRTSPDGDADLGYCMTDLEQRWWIVNGVRAGPLEGLSSFLRATDERKLEQGRWMSGTRGGGDWSENYRYWRDERKFGTARGETTCSWCTFHWFEERLAAWEEG